LIQQRRNSTSNTCSWLPDLW